MSGRDILREWDETVAMEPCDGWAALSTVEVAPVRFADRPLFQADAFHLLVGEKGCGKGTFLASVAARVTRGELGPKRRVIWIAAGEDSLSIDVKPRLLAAGGAPELVIFPTFRPRLPDDVEEIQRAVVAVGDVGLIVLDPLAGMFPGGGRRSTNADTDVREVLDPLNRLADELACLVVGVRHLGKDKTRGALAAVLGSVDWVNIPRAVLAIAPDNEEEDLRHVQVIAGNRAPRGEAGRSFRIVGVRLPELGDEAEPVTRAEMLGSSAKDVEQLLTEAQKPTSRTKQAKLLILDLLEAEGPLESDGLDARIAQATGLEAKSVRNVRSALAKDGLVRNEPVKDGDGKVVRWRVARSRAPRPDALANSSRDLGARAPSQITTAAAPAPETAQPRQITARSLDTLNRDLDLTQDLEATSPDHDSRCTGDLEPAGTPAAPSREAVRAAFAAPPEASP